MRVFHKLIVLFGFFELLKVGNVWWYSTLRQPEGGVLDQVSTSGIPYGYKFWWEI